MDSLPTSIQEALSEFEMTSHFKAYREYVLTETAKCLGMLRSETLDDRMTMYYKGMMRGLEKLMLDLLQYHVTRDEVEKASKTNRDYTEDLLNKSLEQQTDIL